MNKKKIIIIFIFILIIVLLLCLALKPTFNHIKFKNDYESLNGKNNDNGKNYRIINIDKNNPFIYSNDKEILKMLEEKESFYVYFGANWCPWCRSILQVMIETAKENNIDKVYYVDITNIRDEYEYSSGKLKRIKNGSEEYYKLLKLLENVLEDYKVNKNDNETIKTGEKRIYVPLFIKVKNGKPIKSETGISTYQKDPYEKLNNKIKKDVKNKFNDFFHQ